MKIRHVGKMNIVNDAAHSRSLFASITMPEVISALRNWMEIGASGVLIGAAALSFHLRPRVTQDVDFLALDGRGHTRWTAIMSDGVRVVSESGLVARWRETAS